MSRRRTSAGELIVISWRDIPAQVTATRGRDRAKALLDARFQHAIDRAAAVAGLTETNAYVNEWRRNVRPIDGHVEAEADHEAARLDAAYPRERLERLVFQGGVDADPTDPVQRTHTAPDADVQRTHTAPDSPEEEQP